MSYAAWYPRDSVSRVWRWAGPVACGLLGWAGAAIGQDIRPTTLPQLPQQGSVMLPAASLPATFPVPACSCEVDRGHVGPEGWSPETLDPLLWERPVISDAAHRLVYPPVQVERFFWLWEGI